ncbi:MAG TPA: hypothetical protein VI217_09290 [Mycobacterium sp.]
MTTTPPASRAAPTGSADEHCARRIVTKLMTPHLSGVTSDTFTGRVVDITAKHRAAAAG